MIVPEHVLNKITEKGMQVAISHTDLLPVDLS
jgi:hypothetical protein